MAISKRLRYEVLRRDNHACRYCGRSAPEVPLTVDHVVPVALGGSDDPSNLVTACRDCNSGKSASAPDAPIVDGVVDDALRWASAMQQAAVAALADLDRRIELRERFHSRWNDWKAGERTMPLPGGWQSSVDNLLAAGLPIDLLRECIDIAMGAPKVLDDNRFRYMCGVAWNRVADIQEAARSRVSQIGPDELHLSTEQVIGVAIEAVDRITYQIKGDDVFEKLAFEVLRDAIQAGRAALHEARDLGLDGEQTKSVVRGRAREGSAAAEYRLAVEFAEWGLREVPADPTSDGVPF